jgi:WD40 repeat protein
MGQILHGRATTTEAVRGAIQSNQASLRTLAKQYGIDAKTVAKWKKRDHVQDAVRGHTREVYGLAFSPDGQWLGSASADTTIRLWNVESGEPVSVIPGHSSWYRDVSFHPTNALLASAGDDHTVRLWSLPAG